MGMYISLYKKNGDKFERSDEWEDQKFVKNGEAFSIITNNGFCIDKTQPFSDLDQYWRPKNFRKCREEINKLGVNKDIFNELLDILEKNKDLYISYY